ncbi:MAG: dTDP-4-dehydrorhamnose reductase [Alcaligenaceae bacterium]|nr:dTDP-4-dehydrorhamnose reductase [Alcaligenaceae bacterium]
MTNILLTGGAGQLGQAFTACTLTKDLGIELSILDRQSLDITDQEAIETVFQRYQPDVVINAAAYTAVDQAEIEVEQAFAVNVEAAAWLATTCAAHDIGFIHLSTDYVFDGSKLAPYEVNDQPNPLNTYGQSKWAGEQAVFAAYPATVIVRTAWLYSEFGENFQTKILRVAKDRLSSGESLQVVSDQWGSPTYAPDLVAFLLHLSKVLGTNKGRVMHFSGDKIMNRLELAKAILVAALERGELEALPRIEAASTEDYQTLVKRPVHTALKNSELWI